MTGFNLPPGCSTSDLPGNRPEDAAYEAFVDKLCELDAELVDLQKFDDICDWLWKEMGEAYRKGYTQGQSDERLAAEQGGPGFRRLRQNPKYQALVEDTRRLQQEAVERIQAERPKKE